jgi:hypothetical protein
VTRKQIAPKIHSGVVVYITPETLEPYVAFTSHRHDELMTMSSTIDACAFHQISVRHLSLPKDSVQHSESTGSRSGNTLVAMQRRQPEVACRPRVSCDESTLCPSSTIVASARESASPFARLTSTPHLRGGGGVRRRQPLRRSTAL